MSLSDLWSLRKLIRAKYALPFLRGVQTFVALDWSGTLTEDVLRGRLEEFLLLFRLYTWLTVTEADDGLVGTLDGLLEDFDWLIPYVARLLGDEPEFAAKGAPSQAEYIHGTGRYDRGAVSFLEVERIAERFAKCVAELREDKPFIQRRLTEALAEAELPQAA